jgi:hypothetical protein
MQAFTIPFAPHVDLAPSLAGWSIWALTELDHHLRQGLPRSQQPHVDIDEATLLAECLWAEADLIL